jgi:hypothetical protein
MIADSEKRATTSSAPMEETIGAVLHLLSDMPDTPRTRELRVRAETYHWAVEQWEAEHVSARQLRALHDLVHDLHAQAEAAHRSRYRGARVATERLASAPWALGAPAESLFAKHR